MKKTPLGSIHWALPRASRLFFSARAHTLHTVCEEEREEFNARMCIVQVIFPGQICDGAVAKGGRFFFIAKNMLGQPSPGGRMHLAGDQDKGSPCHAN